MSEVKELCDKYDFEIGYTMHRNLCNLTKEIQQELVAPLEQNILDILTVSLMIYNTVCEERIYSKAHSAIKEKILK